MSDARVFIDQHTAAMQNTWDAAAAGWDNNSALIRTWLSAATAAMLDAAGIQPGHQVLDVAAGAGDQTIDIARRIGPHGRVVAIDLSPELIARATINLQRAGCTNAEARVGNGEALGLDATFEAAVCRLGLMFYADPLAGLIELPRALKPGSRAAVLVYLKRFDLIHFELPMSVPGAVPSWADWLKVVRISGVDATRGLRLDAADHALDAAAEGAGVVLAYKTMAMADMRSGRLVSPFGPELPIVGRAYHLVCPAGRETQPKIRAFRDWLKAEIAESERV